MGLIRRTGWGWGTRASRVTAVSMVACRSAFPLMATLTIQMPYPTTPTKHALICNILPGADQMVATVDEVVLGDHATHAT